MDGRSFFDALVIGGGPAGAVAALLLARQGWSVGLVERGDINRNKTCGHCLSPRVLPLLRRLHLLDAARTTAVGCTRTLRVHLPRRRPQEIAITGEPGGSEGLLVPRSRFDQLLRDRAVAAGAAMMQPATARRISFDESGAVVEIAGVEVKRLVRARLLIGADGLRSRVAAASQLAGQPRSRMGRKFGFALNISTPRAAMIQRGSVEMFVMPGGYLGVVNEGGGVLHLAGLVAAGTHESREPLAFCRTLAQRFEVLQQCGVGELTSDRVSGFVAVGPMPWRPWRIANDRAALVGDAAGYVEPFTGEGMTWAIQSAALLAETTIELRPGKWTAHAAARYEQLWRKRIGRSQWLCRGVAAAVSRPRLLSMLARLAEARPMWTRRVVEQVVLP